MQSGVSKTSANDDKEVVRSAFVRLPTGISRRCCVLKEARDGSTFVVELDNRRVITVSARHLWFEGRDSGNGSSCVVCFASGFLLSCKECGRQFHEDCSSMPRPKASGHSTTTSFTCRDCFFMLYTSRTGMENRSIARSSLLLIKEVKKYSTYAYRELLWDALYRSNKASMYCYCGGPGRYFNQMVQCLRCLQWFHRACLHTLPLDRGILPWDCFWYFKCAHCNGSHGEVIRQLPVHWTEILHIAIMNLMAGKSRFCFVKRDILPWLDKNWSFFRPSRKVTLSYATEENIIRHLQSDPARFQCGLEVGASRREWRARCYISGPVRQDLNPIWPVNIPISQERLNDIALERAASEELPLLILNPNAKLPSMEIFDAIYGGRDDYRTVKHRFDSSRLECYNRAEKNCVMQYRPDEDRTAWLSFPDPASLLRRRLHLPLADAIHDRKHRKRKLVARGDDVAEKRRRSDVEAEPPKSAAQGEEEANGETARKVSRRLSAQDKILPSKDVVEKGKRKLKRAVVQEVTDLTEPPVVDLDLDMSVEVAKVSDPTVGSGEFSISEPQVNQPRTEEETVTMEGLEVEEESKDDEEGMLVQEMSKENRGARETVDKGGMETQDKEEAKVQNKRAKEIQDKGERETVNKGAKEADEGTTETVDKEERETLDKGTKATLENGTKVTLDNGTKEKLDEGTIGTADKGTNDADKRTRESTNKGTKEKNEGTREAVDKGERETVNKRTREANKEAKETTDKEAREAVDKEERETVDKRTREAVDKGERETANKRTREAVDKGERETANKRTREANKEAKETTDKEAREAVDKEERETANKRTQEATKEARETLDNGRKEADQGERETLDNGRKEADQGARRHREARDPDVVEVVAIEDSPVKEAVAAKGLGFETVLGTTDVAGQDVMEDIQRTIVEMLDTEEALEEQQELEEDEVSSLPKFRLRSQAASKTKARSVARKSGRPLPLHQPSPPKPLPRTRACSVPLTNFRNWYEITGDAPPRTVPSGACVLQTIPSCLHGQTRAHPFLYRWEVAGKPRLSRARLIRHGLPARHATSTPLKPQNPRKKTEFETDGVVTVLAKRSQNLCPTSAPVEPKKGLKANLKTDVDTAIADADDEFRDLLLLWNRKHVHMDRC